MYTVLYTSACYPCDSLGHIVHCITVVLCEYVKYLHVHVQCTCTCMYVCLVISIIIIHYMYIN